MMLSVLTSIGAIQVLVMLVGLARAKMLSVLLGPAQFGVVSTIDQTVVTVVTLSALSLPFTALKLMSSTHSQGEEQFQRTYSTFLRVLIRLSVVGAIAASALLMWRPGLLGSDLAPYRGYLLIALLTVPAVMLNMFFVNTLAAAQAPAASAGLTLAVGSVLAAAAVVGAAVHGIIGIYTLSALAGLGATAGTLWYLRRRLGVRVLAGVGSLRQDLRARPEILSQSALFYFATTAYSVAMLAARYVTFSRLGDVQAGLLQAQLSLGLAVGAIVTPMSNLYLAPLVNRQSAARVKMTAADDFTGKVAVLILLASFPVVLFPRLAVTVLFSREFILASRLLCLFVAWQALLQLVNVYVQLLIGLDDVTFMMAMLGGGYLCAIALLPMCIPMFGTAGAAIALIAGVAATGIAAMLRLRLKFGHVMAFHAWSRIGLVLAVLGIAGFIFPTSTEWTPSGITARLTYAAMVLVLLAWKGLTEEERDLFRRPLGRAPAI